MNSPLRFLPTQACFGPNWTCGSEFIRPKSVVLSARRPVPHSGSVTLRRSTTGLPPALFLTSQWASAESR